MSDILVIELPAEMTEASQMRGAAQGEDSKQGHPRTVCSDESQRVC